MALGALLAFLVTAASGFVADRALRGNLIDDARSGAELVVAPALRGHLSRRDLRRPATRARTKRLRAALSPARRRGMGVRIWNRAGASVYADRLGSRLPSPSEG